MASIGHIAIGMAAGRLYAPGEPAQRALAFRMLALSAVSLLPDADVISFGLGIPDEAPFGHRGASHSLVIALALGVLRASSAPGKPRKGITRGIVG